MRLTLLSVLALVLSMFLAGCAQAPENGEMEDKLSELEQKVETIEEDVDVLEAKVEDLEEEVEELKNGMIEPPPEEEVPPVAKDKIRFLIKVENVHDSITLSPGVFIAHKPPMSINYVNKLIPDEMEPLVEYGSNMPFYEYLKEGDGALALFALNQSLAPGESASFILDVPKDKPRETYLSGLMMLVQTNDGFALANNIALFTQGNGPKNSTTEAQNYDAGTEENSPVGIGFVGGQPDPEKGEENIDNGTPSVPQRPVTPHAQVQKTVMRITVTPQ